MTHPLLASRVPYLLSSVTHPPLSDYSFSSSAPFIDTELEIKDAELEIKEAELEIKEAELEIKEAELENHA